MRAEVDELRSYAALARSITVNQKAVKLGEALDKGFERLQELGAPQKAIIFTDSTKTQEYIARTLAEAGRGDGLVLFNGTNNSPGANEIYRDWLEANKDGDVITGIPAADRRKALVDYFRDRGHDHDRHRSGSRRHQPAVLLDARQLRPARGTRSASSSASVACTASARSSTSSS